MNITNVKYTEQGSISATIGGQEFTLPDQAGNRHRQSIAEWEADGNTIAAYVAPEDPPRRIGTSREFLQLFTQQERINIHASTNPVIMDWVLIALGGDFSLDHADTAAGTGALVQLGIITAERRAEVLGNDFDNPVITPEP